MRQDSSLLYPLQKVRFPGPYAMRADQSRLNKPCNYLLPAEAPRLLPVPDWADLTPPNLCHTLEAQVLSIVGDGRRQQAAAALYFRTVHT